MKTILSFIVLAMAVLVMGCGEPTTPEASNDVKTTSAADSDSSCSCCTKCEDCNDGEKCECTAAKSESASCDCKCDKKDGGEGEHVHADGSHKKEGSDSKAAE